MRASSHDHPELGPPELIEVADGVFAYVQPDGSWYINNTGFVVGPSVNTHHHGDHTYGNSLFGTATIIAQEKCRAEMIAYNGGRPLSCYA